MNVLVYLLPLALLLGLGGLFAFLWSLRSGQYDDLDGAAVRVLSDDDLPKDGPSKSDLKTS
ncbi:cbb3-type cytochrome oxidase assembly protein CcoS [Xanthobacter dioxanivorans]|uniref:Cbb3-type cytochrome oxidase assembly protein CcoS n=1 Tax=Xanthobacter dioxanivorans TaxID=2528964 RepID=A0A974SJ55_9HYPH|nr:cbb3-type cytochrome oxidase assembly protein CcoS [Xanthobacter dioxanivorans]QRG07435.1 cbb3-type cytochrome oxidase assembly protein CcoS [Xanthobacter dioxanivorans]